MSNTQAVNVRFSNQKVRTDLFGTDSAASQPGPGAYASPERKAAKVFSIGVPREKKISSTPGPGNYDNSNEINKKTEKGGLIS